ncbi:MAG: pirin family protein [Saprospiraceae bacterium]|nr:pirin family protein [Saprospiraceae bacterium]
MSNSILHKSETRGRANHGWLDARHSFSFAGYYNPERMHFGVLRVLNDDIVAPAMGFGTHPHDNMEIITIPLRGALRHRDSMGNEAVIQQNEVQVMSAGTGIQHSEFNANRDKDINLLQIWLFPKFRNVKPRYAQHTFLPEDRVNQLQVVVAPLGSEEEKGDAVGIHQDAWFSLGTLKQGFEEAYNVKKAGNGVYVFVIEGSATVDGQPLSKRDALGVWDTDSVHIKADSDAEILIMDIPMSLG